MIRCFSLLLIAASLGCNADNIPNYIPGTYVRYLETEFGHSSDTMRIRRVDSTRGGYYQVRVTGVIYNTIDGVTFPPKRTIMHAVLLYDPVRKVLTDPGYSMGTICFNPDHQEAIMDGYIFKRAGK